MACDNQALSKALNVVNSMTEYEFMDALLFNKHYPDTKPVIAALLERAYRELKGMYNDRCAQAPEVEESQEDTPPDLQTLLESTQGDKEHERFIKESVVRADPEWCMSRYPEFMMFYNLPWVEENALKYLFERMPEYVADKYPEVASERYTKWMIENRFDYMALEHPEKVYEDNKFRHSLADRNPKWMFENHPEEALRMNAKWCSKEWPEEVFNVDPKILVKYNPKWVLDNRFEWAIVNQFQILKRNHHSLLMNYVDQLPEIYKDQLND